MTVKKIKDIKSEEVKAGEGTTRQILISPEEAPNFALRKFKINPGGGMPAHTNSVEHEQYVLSGEARVGIGDKVYKVEKDDVVFIPAGTAHWYRVEGSEPFEFLCIVPNGYDRITLIENSG